MGIIQRQTVLFSAIGFLGTAIGAISTVCIYPNVLEQYGLYQFLAQASLTFFPLAVLGSHRLTVRYFPDFQDDTQGHKGFLGFVLTLVAMGVGLLALVFFMARPHIEAAFLGIGKNPFYLDYLGYGMAFIALYAPCSVMQYYLNNFHRTAFPFLLMDFGVKVLLAVLLFSVWKDWLTVDAMLRILLSYYAVVFLLLLGFAKKLGQLHVRFQWKDYLPYFKRDMPMYMLLGVLGGFGFQLATDAGSILLVGTLTTAEKTGVYSIALFMATVMGIPVKGLVAGSIAKIARYWKDEDMAAMKHLYVRASSNLMVPGLLIFLAAWVSIDSVFDLFQNSEVLKEGKYAFFFLGLNKVIDMAAGLNNHLIHYSKYYAWLLVTTVLLGVSNILLSLWLIPTYGITGAAISTASCFLLYNISNILLVYLKTGLQPWTRKTLYTIMVGLFSFAVACAIPKIEPPLLNIVLHSGVFALIYSVLAFKLELAEDLNGMVMGYLRK